MLQPDRDLDHVKGSLTKGCVAPVLMSFLSTIVLTLAVGGLLVVLRSVFRLRRSWPTDLALAALGGVLIIGLHLLSRDLFGFDPTPSLSFDMAKHALELVIILLILAAF